ncbi:MAG: MFS transporter [Actinocatenispora sp.]
MITRTTRRQHRWRWVALAALLVAEAMNLLDTTIVQVAAPVIHDRLGGTESEIQWFSAAYTLPFALLLITGGRLGDIAGRRRMFLAGVAGFAVASVACALAPTAALLIGARAVQGATAALIIPQTFGLIKAMFRGQERARALGRIGLVMGLAAVSGPVLGGVLTHADLLGASWRPVFLVNVPLAVAVLAAGPLLSEDSADHRPRLDLTGTGLAVLGIGLIVVPLVDGTGDGWPAWHWLTLTAGVAVLVAFGASQRAAARRGRHPLVETSLFTGRGFPAALVTSTLFFAVMNGLMLVIVLHLQVGLGRDVLTGGLTLLPWSAGTAVASWVAGSLLVPRYGARVMFVGLVTLAAGLLGAITAYRVGTPGGYPWPLLPALAVSGLGLGLFTVPFFTTALNGLRAEETGSGSGLLNAVQQLGAAAGVTVLGSVFLHGLRGGTGDTPAHAAGTAAQHAFWLALAFVAAATVGATVMSTAPRRPVDDGAADQVTEPVPTGPAGS